LLKNVFEFGEVTAAEVMVPRTSLVAISHAATFDILLEEVAKTSHSRYPVIGASLDDIRGIIDFKKMAKPLSKGKLGLQTPIKSWICPAKFVPETTPLSELLPMMQRSHLAMVMVVDEFGGTAGLVTLKDLIAEIIGDGPESDISEDLTVQILDEYTFLVQAQMNMEEVNELLDLNLPVIDDYHTLGGFLLDKFQKIPVPGETLNYDNLELTVVSASGPRLNQIRISRQQPQGKNSVDVSDSEQMPIIPRKDDVSFDNGGL
ncbi:MAG: HlyC/CorC family transporter, partial [Moorea sp. SIO3E2]|nr:HlyC/CorC family transporter [Moorena sp. SIO3E2]